MKRIVLVLLVLLIAISTANAKAYTKVVLNNGSVVEGVLIEENSQIIRLELANRNIKILYRSDIESISTVCEAQSQRKHLLEGRWAQFVDLSYSYCCVADFLGVNYIGGYRFNPYLFLGAGTGLNFSLGTPDIEKLTLPFCRPTTVNVPIYIHFKANFTKTIWSPYISVSIGGRLSETRHKDVGGGYGFTYNQSGFLGNLSFGVDRAITKEISLYCGVGYKIESFLYSNYIGGNFMCGNKFAHGFSVNIGLSF